MKKIFMSLLMLVVFSNFVAGQIMTTPETDMNNIELRPASVGTLSNKDMYFVTNNFSALYLSSYQNIGIGTAYNTGGNGNPLVHRTDAKLHIRYNSGTSGNDATLLLDESTNDYARLRFRQSALLPNGSFTVYTPSTRFWDIAGYSNGNNTSNDFLNFYNSAGGNVMSLVGNGDANISGFTKLGTTVPAGAAAGATTPSIKTLKLTGTTAATQGGIVTVAHGLTMAKILGIQVLVFDDATNNLITPEYSYGSGYTFSVYCNTTIIGIINAVAPKSGSILNKTFTVLITYEE